jgi:hypothetical protein
MTNKIPLALCDNKIWNSDRFIIDLISMSLVNINDIEIDLLFEGPCIKSVGLDNILDSIVNEFGFDPKRYTIITSNQLSSSDYNEIRTPFVELEFIKNNITSEMHNPTTLSKRFGIFISRSNHMRFGIASYIWNNCKNSAMTYHYSHTDDYHIPNFGFETFINRNWDSWDSAVNFVKHTPMVVTKETYPIALNKNALSISSLYSDMFCEVICETFFTGRTFFITEKTLRCIMNRRPFVIQGPKWYIKNLHLLGFKTFNRWWCEAYDIDADDARFGTIINCLEWINKQNQHTIDNWYLEMGDILDHNINVLRMLTDEKIHNTEYFYE